MGRNHDYGDFVVVDGEIFMKQVGQWKPTVSGNYSVMICVGSNRILSTKLIQIQK